MMLSKRLAMPSFSQISSHQLDVTKFPNHLDTNEVKKGSIYSQETMDKLGIFRNIMMIWFDKTIWIFFIFIERIADL